jgi:multidrug efflux pump subunit AcrA (membrane-fusion protein)
MKTFANKKIISFSRLLLSGLFFLLLFPACKPPVTDEGDGDEVEATTPVTITNVRFGPISEVVELNAVSIFQKKVSVKATTTGYIDEINANLGGNVGMDQLLFTIKTREATALNNPSMDSIIKFSGIIKINAQKSGTITSLAHQKGDYVQDGDELAVISERSSLVFLLQVPFEMNAFVKIGADVEIILPGDSVLKGKITGSLPEVDAVSQTQQFVVKAITNQLLPENLIAKVRIVKSTKEKATIIPKEALLSDETQSEFWVMKLMNDSTAVRVNVKTGIQSEDEAEIVDPAFTEQDRILLTGNYGIADTAKVSIKPENK